MKINCKEYAQGILDKVKEVPNKKALAIITVGSDKPSRAYVKGKIKDCEACGVPWYHFVYSKDDKPELVARLIDMLNKNDDVGGIILQLPTSYDSEVEQALINRISSRKDVDGFKEDSPFYPCTPEGIMYILKKEYGEDGLAGLDVLLIGRGELVGGPLIDMLLNENCTLTIAHSYTKDLNKLIRARRNVMITAINKVKEIPLMYAGADVIVDAGIGYSDGKLCGNCYDLCTSANDYALTPVPGGVGLMTRAVLMAHMAQATDANFKY